MNYFETFADIVADIRKEAILRKSKFGKSYLEIIAYRIEEACKRAYNEIGSAVCGIDSATLSDIDDVRKAMDETIGDYYE